MQNQLMTNNDPFYPLFKSLSKKFCPACGWVMDIADQIQTVPNASPALRNFAQGASNIALLVGLACFTSWAAEKI